MSWDQKYVNYGVIKIDASFNVVRVFHSNTSYDNIHISDVISAVWAGNEVLITQKNGKMRKYSSTSSYNNV